MPQFGHDLRSIKDGEEIRKTNWAKERAPEESQSSRNDKTVTIVVVVPCLMGCLLYMTFDKVYDWFFKNFLPYDKVVTIVSFIVLTAFPSTACVVSLTNPTGV